MKTGPLRIVFAGTPAFGLPALDAIYTAHHLVGVYTQPDRPTGRGQRVQDSPVKAWAGAHHIPVYQPINFKAPQALQQLAALAPDVMVVIAYGLILPAAVLEIPRLGCINVHASLLPAHRGASPIQQAILSGDWETGVTIMQMDVGMDTGDMFTQVKTPLSREETAETLHDRLSVLSVAPLLQVLAHMASGEAQATPQTHAQATYTKKIQKEAAHIDWTQPASDLDRMIRAYHPWPVAFTFYQGLRMRVIQAQPEASPSRATPGEILSIDTSGLRVATGAGVIRIQKLQFAGGNVLHVAEWLHAKSPMLQVGGRFESVGCHA